MGDGTFGTWSNITLSLTTGYLNVDLPRSAIAKLRRSREYLSDRFGSQIRPLTSQPEERNVNVVWNRTKSSKLFHRAHHGLFFVYFRSFQSQILKEKTVGGGGGIQTRIVGVEGKHADHLTTITAQTLFTFSVEALYFNKIWGTLFGGVCLKNSALVQTYVDCDYL